MPTKTRTKSAAELLADLEAERDRLRNNVRDLKREESAWHDQTEAIRCEYTARGHSHAEEFDRGGRPIKGTAAAKLKDKISQRTESPVADQLRAAIKEFHAAENLATQFRVENFHEIVGSFEPDPEDVTARMLTGFEMLKEAAGDYNLLTERTREFAIDTPGINGQHVTFDGRVAEWAKLAEAALAEPLNRPGIDAMGEYHLKVARDAVKESDDE